MDLTEEEAEFEQKEAFTGAELVHETHRLALMNAMLHDIEGKIYLCDTLSNQGKVMHGFDVVLTNPPFGTKKAESGQIVMTLPIRRAISSLIFCSIFTVL